ncbi:hypothetical protein TraAM80_05174 [Trypanosoma rangeli]|uniref:Uncharacterized protein n=1 Tax=Trypanosoma rangeli TaxID=5698 RepID=A0A3R7NLL7_TRYRA|nr:uncharacterized protein TraAM80_05174 [Trypanosoma rangeli]RNF04458.1 hypothetical protein TraAM80_05174 [Trypanosoma rangeli]|eukprot:RNF04458.1 hypothetical protein TraAM80_05174 [Trypanosoma rangeli]
MLPYPRRTHYGSSLVICTEAHFSKQRRKLCDGTGDVSRSSACLQLHIFCIYFFLGDGFREDVFVQELRRSTKYVFASTKDGETLSANNALLNAMWILAPRGNSQFRGGAGVRSMHLDEWKLIILGMSFEIAVYDFTSEAKRGQQGIWVTPLLMLSL